jgi:hypothetical protein
VTRPRAAKSKRSWAAPAVPASKRATRVERAPRAATATQPAAVDAFVAKLRHPLEAEITVLRKLLRGADRRVVEEIKWNAPSYKLAEHFATFNLRKRDAIQIVFHTGAKRKATAKAPQIDDPQSLLQWLAKDRALVTLRATDVKPKSAALRALVKQWIAAL